jgi:CubicO group peptidase (beta-lactamase class C family)
MVQVHGEVADGYGKVADAFAANFEHHGELGAAFSLVVGGDTVVDVWGGIADKASGAPWQDDTLALVFSTTKGVTAICVAMLVERGALSYDDAVADHWPEFAANGKEGITLRQVLSHQAGLPYVDRPLDLDELCEVAPVVEALAAAPPVWPPGTAHGYHALTYGWLAGEVLRRVDGRPLGQFVREEVAIPLGLDLWIGLPEAEEPRVAPLEPAPRPTDPAVLEMMQQVMGPGTTGGRALTMNGAVDFSDVAKVFNSRQVHATEMPAANGITTARSLAHLYAATIGEVGGHRLVNDDTVAAMSAEQVRGPDESLVLETRFGLGFMLHGLLCPMLTPDSFGHPGAGGSLGYASPSAGVAYGYVMNQMGGGVAGDPRTIALNDAVRACL